MIIPRQFDANIQAEVFSNHYQRGIMQYVVILNWFSFLG